MEEQLPLGEHGSPTYPRNRKHFTNPTASCLPKRIILVRHGESLGNLFITTEHEHLYP